jgi:2-polyprenyl-3-methyl-5-hydroxy-6-metoxy-1,4-benzoquinol methylase
LIRSFATTDNHDVRCWCGNDSLTHFAEGYRHCDACQTLVSTHSTNPSDPRVRDDSTHYYGRDYWFGHQTNDLNLPDIVTRSRTDLSERCVHWLRSLLQYKLPPAKVLEIGCAHGGFVALLRRAGYDAVGLELSPSIVEFAKSTFNVPILTGPIEDQSIPPASLDAIIMMDVMEHLPRPRQTLGRCLDLLKPDGILLVQTPGYPEQKSLADLQSTGHKFPQMLDPNEHLFLFSPTSAKQIFRQLNAPFIEFIPALFGFYDMSFVVSRSPLRHLSTQEQETALASTLGGRFMQAMLDLDQRRLALLSKYRLERIRAAS